MKTIAKIVIFGSLFTSSCAFALSLMPDSSLKSATALAGVNVPFNTAKIKSPDRSNVYIDNTGLLDQTSLISGNSVVMDLPNRKESTSSETRSVGISSESNTAGNSDKTFFNYTKGVRVMEVIGGNLQIGTR